MNLNAFVRIFLISLVIFVQACTVQKSHGDVSKTQLFLHNLNAKYNGYFNANELMIASTDAIISKYHQDYSKIIELYEENAGEKPTEASANLDIAIQKATTVVNLHRPSHWVPDCYLMIGKAQYLKRDYATAEETFKFMTKNYNRLHENPKLDPKKKAAQDRAERVAAQAEKREEASKTKAEAKKKSDKEKKQKEKAREKQRKEKERERKQIAKDRAKGIRTPRTTTPKVLTPKPDSMNVKRTTPAKAVDKETDEVVQKPNEGIKPNGKHRPVLQDAQIWLAKTYIMRKNGIAAGIILGTLRTDPGLYQVLKPEIPVLQAYNEIKQENYEEAIPYLKESLEEKNLPNKTKAKCAFALGQIYQILNQGSSAYDAFNRVDELSTDYEMTFFAELYKAQNAASTGTKSTAQLLDDLKKLTKDAKNTNYQTAIYHSMALVSLKANDRVQAKDYLLKGLSSSGDRIQKTESFYLIANLYNEDEDYLRAKNYYDSTLTVMTTIDTRRPEVEKYANSLVDIAKHISIIELQDSLMRLSSLTEKEQKQWAKKIIKEREKAKELELAKGNNQVSPFSNELASAFKSSIPDINASTKSTFFAYDDKQLKRGQRDFQQTWGKIKLVDNWAIKTKAATNLIDDNPNGTKKNEEEVTTSDDELASLLKDIPHTSEEKESSHEKKRNSMLILGTLYREKLENYPKAIKILEEYLAKYPNTTQEVDVLYQLYLAYTQNNDKANRERIKQIILQNFPSSKYAQTILHPEAAIGEKDKLARLTRYYDETFELYNQGKCDEVLSRISQVDSLFKENPIRAKFALIETMCIGKSRGKEAYIGALKDFIARYPNGSERDKAKDMLRYLMGDDKAFETSDIIKTNNDPNAYDYNADELHYVIAIVYDKKDATITNIKVTVSDFNQKYFSNDDLRISNIFLDQDGTIPVIMVRKFDNAEASLRYYQTVMANANQFITSDIKHDVYPISQSNYRKLYATKDVDTYKQFFEKNYKK